MTIMSPEDLNEPYTYNNTSFEEQEEISSTQRMNIEKIVKEIERKYQLSSDNPDDYELIIHPNSFVFKTRREAVYKAALKIFTDLKQALLDLKEDEQFSNTQIKRILNTDKTSSGPQYSNNVVYPIQITLEGKHVHKAPYKDYLKRAAEYFLDRKVSGNQTLKIINLEDSIRIETSDHKEFEILKRIYAQIVSSPTILGRDELGQLYVAKKREYQSELKVQKKETKPEPVPLPKAPQKKPDLYELELTEEDVPHLPDLLKVFNLSRSAKTPGYLIKAFGNAQIIPSSENASSLYVKLPTYDDMKETDLAKSKIIEGLTFLALSAKSGATKRISRDNLISHFESLKTAPPSQSKKVAPYKQVQAQQKPSIPKPPPLTQFSVPRIDGENAFKSGDEKFRLTASDTAFLKAMEDRPAVMVLSMQQKDKVFDKTWLAALRALDGLRKGTYQHILIAARASDFFHIEKTLKRFENILGHLDATQGPILLKKLMEEKRIDISYDPLQPSSDYKQAFILLNGCEDFKWDELTEALKKTTPLSTIAFLGMDENYNNPEQASTYKFFYDRFTKGVYAKHVRGFIIDGEPSATHEVLQAMLLHGDDQAPKILVDRNALKTKLPEPKI